MQRVTEGVKKRETQRGGGSVSRSEQLQVGEQEFHLAVVQLFAGLLTAGEDDDLGDGFGESGRGIGGGRGGRDKAGEIIQGDMEEGSEADGEGEGDVAFAAFVAAVLVGVHEHFFGHILLEKVGVLAEIAQTVRHRETPFCEFLTRKYL